MTTIAAFDLISFLFVLMAIAILLACWKRALSRNAKVLLAGLLAVTLFHGLSNVLEWGRVTAVLDPFEDYTGLLEPFLWGLFLYTFLQESAAQDLRKSFEEKKELSRIINISPAVAFLWRAKKGWPVQFVSKNVQQFGYSQEDFYSGRVCFADIIHPDDIECVTAEVAQYSQEGRNDFVQEYRVVTKAGETRWVEDHTWVRRDSNGKITYYQGIVLDITDRKKAEKSLQQQTRELAILNTLSQGVSSSLSLDQVVKAVIAGAVKATHPDLVLLFLREGDRLFLKSAAPENSQFIHNETPVHHVGECLCGLVVSQGKPVFSVNIHNDSRCTWDECKKTGLHSFAALPLQSGDHIFGVLGLASGTERDFGEQTAFLETLSAQISIGMQNALLHEELERHAAGLEERVAERTAELEKKTKELERFNRLFVERELRMIELKKEIKKLTEKP